MNGYLRESDIEVASTAQETIPSAGPGEILRKHRESFGLTPADVAIRLRLRTCFIDALEQNDYQKIPNLVFARGYLRSYARILQLSENDIVQKFEQLQLTDNSSAVRSPLRNSFKKPPSKEHSTLPWIMLGVAIIIFVIAGFWKPLTQQIGHTLLGSPSSDTVVETIQPQQEKYNSSEESSQESVEPSILPELEPLKST